MPYPLKPTEQHIREGTWRADRHPEPMALAGIPRAGELSEPPDRLGPIAAEFWRTTVVRLVECGIVDRVDVPLLEMMAVQYSRAVQAGRAIAHSGMFTKGSTGQITDHPAVKIEREATALFWRLAEGFGIGPLGRTRLGLAELHRRSLQQEMTEILGGPDLVDVDAS
jgi:P27 family predicted phage terminase small subunit